MSVDHTLWQAGAESVQPCSCTLPESSIQLCWQVLDRLEYCVLEPFDRAQSGVSAAHEEVLHVAFELLGHWRLPSACLMFYWMWLQTV